MSERKGEKEEAEEEDTRRITGAEQKPNKIRGTDVREKNQPDGSDQKQDLEKDKVGRSRNSTSSR